MNEDTQEVPLPEGVRRNPDATTTQELPVVDPFPDVRLVTPVKVVLPSQAQTVRVETLPPHLLGDPILTMDAPVADNMPLYNQIHGKPERRKPAPPRRRMPVGDKVLIGMGAAALVMGVGVYGMVEGGWGAGHMPEEKAASAPHKPAPDTSGPQEPEASPSAPRPVRSPEKKPPVEVAAAPETYAPRPERSIVVVSPTPSGEPTTPEPTPTEKPSPTPTHTSASPRPSETPAPTPSATPSATPTRTITIPPPVTQSQSLSATPTEENAV